MSGVVSAGAPIAIGRLTGRFSRARVRGYDSASPELAPGERILIRAPLLDGGDCRGSLAALHLRQGSAAWRRIGWDEVATLGWSRSDGALQLRLWPGAEPAGELVPLRSGSRLADFARERVTASRLATQRVSLGPGLDAIICAVRTPTADAPVWRIWFGPGCDRADPAIREAADRALASLRSQLGC